MKRTVLKQIAAAVLIVCTTMTTTICEAAPRGRGGRGGRWPNFTSESTQEEQETTNSETTMTLVESADTVVNGDELRASTYLLSTSDTSSGSVMLADDTTASSTTLKYFPVTMYNYDETTINNATMKKETSWWEYQGLYFNDGDPGDRYAAWNWWNKKSGNNENGQKTWTGLVQSSLDAKGDIVFNVPEGGIFNSDSTVKAIYTSVELPFVYEDGTYTFDASENGVYFHEDATQESSGTAGSNTRLYFNQGNTQTNGSGYGDGSTTVWMPFNDANRINGEGNCDYHFGMKATIPFTMNANGRMVATDDNSDAIQFSFSGDDDVWVFIDGQLVIDLGGIHNRLDAAIDFAANTVTYSESNASNAATGSYNDADFGLTQTLFGNLIGQDRATFAASESHELTIFYLERGKGSSNCKIEFNLPMKDSVTVTKHATKSYDENTKSISNLTNSEQAVVNNIDFGFTLYQKITKEDGTETTKAMANTNYYLINADGQVVSNPSTDAKGHFTLKNGYSAKFITELNSDVTYYVVEDSVSSIGFVTPDYNYGGEAANGFTYTDGTTKTDVAKGSDIPEQEIPGDAAENKSYEVTAKGSDESEDSLVFICENYLDANLPNPSSRPVQDIIVIDYGLPVEIDVLANDVYRGDTMELTKVTGSGLTINKETGEITTEGESLTYGTAEIENGKIVYTLNKQMTGVEVINYVAKVTGTSGNTAGGSTTISEYGVGTVYIVPATTMYYEENFGLVTYTGSYWDTDYTVDAAYVSATQEPGVVGTVGDSPYGSDTAYLNDSKDSNGTSKYANTTNGAVKFEYTFTGTGTSFFARTSNNTGYMRVQLYKGDTLISQLYRDTYYDTTDDAAVLYNVPVYTSDELDYGTYKVVVTVAKASTSLGYHSDFWLDGIRVVQPLNQGDENGVGADANINVALSAYATDEEANMVNVTLRQKMITTDESGNIVWSEEGNFVVFTDTEGEITSAADYESIGPKEEIYLNEGQTIRFSLKNWDPDTNFLYMGMKAPFGSAVVTVNGTDITLKNAADCYYEIGDYATITTKYEQLVTDKGLVYKSSDGTLYYQYEDADGKIVYENEAGDIVDVSTITLTAVDDTTLPYYVATFHFTAKDSIVSLTNIKVTGDFEFTIIEKEDVNVEGSENESK